MERTESKIIQSPNDKKDYRAITLSNKLTIVLVSDPSAEIAAASLRVAVGSLEDPKDMQGLAHFLEHMLFLGTEKYPNEAEYSEYLSKNSGSSNAFTTLTDTTYYFDCKTSALEEALDRFSQFFVAPLFTESCTEREMNAVNSEHQNNVLQDEWRYNQVFLSSAHPENPYNRFATGNLETLSHKDIRSALIEFYKKHYSANVMKAVIYGNQDLDTLEKWATLYFTPIKNYDNRPLQYTELPFNKDNFSDFWKIVPIKDQNILEFIWILENFEPHYKSNPGSYYTHLLGHEGKNSLLSFLRDEGLVYDLSAGYATEMNLFSKFAITITLTQEGLEKYLDVVAYVFQYLNILKKRGPSQNTFEEINKVNTIKWIHKEKQAPSECVLTAVHALHHYPIEDIFRHPYLFEELNADLLQKTIDSFTLDNLRIVLSTQKAESECKETEVWYQTKYSKAPLPDAIKELYKNPQLEPKRTKKVLDLPPKNVFIPQNFDIYAKDFEKLAKYPQKIYASEMSDVWFKQDNIFKTPKGSLKAIIYTNDCGFGVLNEAFLKLLLWNQLIVEHLNEITYSASLAALNSGFDAGPTGLVLSITGFTDSMPYLMEEVVKGMLSFEPENYQNHFKNIRQKVVQNLQNFLKSPPFQQGMAFLGGVTKKSADDFHPIEAISLLANISFEKFVAFHKEWLLNVRMEWLITGNFEEQKAIEMVKNTEELLQSKGKKVRVLPKELIPEVRLVDIPANTSWIYEIELSANETGTSESNSVAISYLQYDLETLEKCHLNTLLVKFLLTPFFEAIRTKQQLGYIVGVVDISISAVLGLGFIIQSPVQPPNYLSARISEFLEEIWAEMQNLSDEDFQSYREAIASELKEKDYNLGQESGRYWTEILRHSYRFDIKELLLENLATIKKEQLIQAFEQMFIKKRKLLEVHVISSEHLEKNTVLKKERLEKEKSTKFFTSMESLRRQIPLHPDYNSFP